MISPWSSNFDTNKVKIQPFHCNKTIGHSQFQTLLNYLKKPNKDKSKFIQTNFENFHSSELVIGQ